MTHQNPAVGVLPDPRIAPYLAAADAVLADLPPGERAELLEDLAAHLHEIAAEEGDALEQRLGPPQEYANEFRGSAGYPPAGPRPTLARSGRLRRTASRATRRSHDLGAATVEATRRMPGGPGLLGFLSRLRPAWWVLRAWLAALVIGVDWPLGSYEGSGWWWALCWQLAFVAASVAWGLRAESRGHLMRRPERYLLAALNAFAAACCFLALFGAGPVAAMRGPQEVVYVGSGDGFTPSASGLWLDGEPVTNFVAYDLAGRPIEGFQLFDQNGRQVTVDEDQVVALQAVDAYVVPVTSSNGAAVDNVFPIRRVEANEPEDCPAVDEDGACDPAAQATVLGQQPIPSGSPWRDLTVTPVPAVGSTIQFDAEWNPIWSPAQPTGAPTADASQPSPDPAPSASPTGSPTGAPSASEGEKAPSPTPSSESEAGSP